MKAMILAAGFGTRLKPLTLRRPKALLPIGNVPLIHRCVKYLKSHGVSEIIVNTHHLHEQIETYLDAGRPFGIPMDVRHEPVLLGTGGGIRNTADFWGRAPFIVINGDIVTDIDLREAYEVHRHMGNLATLLLHDHPSYNLLRVDDRLNIRDIATETGPGKLAFTGIHILEPDMLSHIPAGVFSSIITWYRDLIRKGAPIRAHIVTSPYWLDIGTLDGYKQANRDTLEGALLLQGRGCRLHPSVEIRGWAILGNGASIAEGVRLERSILWENVRITEGRRVTDSIVTDSKTVRHDLASTVF